MHDTDVSRTILVVGGTGYIGSAVVQALMSEKCNVVVASREVGKFNAFAKNVRHVSMDILDRDSVLSATVDVDCIVDCYRESSGEQESADAIANILHACEINRVEKLIYLSSVAFYGAAKGLVDEWTPPTAPVNWYGRAKSHAERACQAMTSASFHVAVLRPTLVYGPGGEEWFTSFLRSIKSRRLGGLGSHGEGFANLIYVHDLAGMCSKLATSPIPQFSIFIANGSEQVTFNRYFQEIRDALGPNFELQKPVPRWIVMLEGKCRRLVRGSIKVLRRSADILLRSPQGLGRTLDNIERPFRPRPEDQAYRGFAERTFYSPLAAQTSGIAARTSLREGVKRSIEWARNANII